MLGQTLYLNLPYEAFKSPTVRWFLFEVYFGAWKAESVMEALHSLSDTYKAFEHKLYRSPQMEMQVP
jgi:hypothetical protein